MNIFERMNAAPELVQRYLKREITATEFGRLLGGYSESSVRLAISRKGLKRDPAPTREDSGPTNIVDKIKARPDLIEQYVKRQISAEQLGEALGNYHATYVHITLSRMGIKRERNPESTYAKAKEAERLARTRHEFRLFLAHKVVAGELKADKAAETAGCSERTMWRYVNEARGKERG